MDLRLYRTWYWENVSTRIGGQPEFVLRHRDQLQYRDPEGAWTPVSIEEAPRPENPEEKRRREIMERAAADPTIDELCRLAFSQLHSKGGV